MLAIAAVALSNGNYKRVVNGVDFRGCICGTYSKIESDGSCKEVAEGADGAFLPGSRSLFGIPIPDTANPNLQAASVVVCTKTCPSTPTTGSSFPGIQLACYDANQQTVLATGATYSEQRSSLTTCAGTIFATSAPSRSLSGYCIPGAAANANMTNIKAAVDKVLGAGSWGSAVNSLARSWPLMLGLCFAALAVAFLYLFVVQYCAGILTVVAIVVVGASVIAGGAFFLLRADATAKSIGEGYSSDSGWQMNFYGGIALEVLAALYVCLVAFMWSRIFLAIELMTHAGKALRDVWGVLFVPLGLVPLTIAVAAFWCATTVLMFSLGTITTVDVSGVPDGTLRSFTFDDTIRYALLYHLFGLFWVTQFIQAVTELVIAFAATHWYFSPVVGGKKELHPRATLFAFNTVLRYHLGTAAFGSAIIAVIKTIRTVIEYVHARVKRAGRDNTCIRAVACMCRCCFWCLDCCMRFINRNAYCVVALTKQGFCASASTAFGYMASNLARVGALAGVSTAFLFLGKLFVAGVTTSACYIVLTTVPAYADDANIDTVVSTPFWPCLVVFVVSYSIGSLFMGVYAVTIDSMLMCYIYNEDKNIIDTDTGEVISKLNAKAIKAGHGSEYATDDDGVGETVTEGVKVSEAEGASRPTYT